MFGFFQKIRTLFCIEPLLTRFGVTSTCRASFAMYNTRAEIDVLADALVRAGKMFV